MANLRTLEDLGSADASTRDRLLLAGLRAFSTQGYDGASLREIERSAGVSRGLIAHHFSTKELLWKECVNWLMGQFHGELERLQENLADVSAYERSRVLLRVYVRFAAKHPEYTRLLMLSGDDDSERYRWMIETWIRPNFLFYSLMSRSETDAAEEGMRAMKTYAFMGAASMMFTLPVEAQLVFGVDVKDEAFIEQFAELLVQWVNIDLPTEEAPGFDSDLERAAEKSLTRRSQGEHARHEGIADV